MTETPREYKRRIDEKWGKNEKNRDNLIQQIEKYELVDEKYKARTKQEILDNFEKNEKADKESDNYKIIASELEKVDKKYEELEELKKILKSKKQEESGLLKQLDELDMD